MGSRFAHAGPGPHSGTPRALGGARVRLDSADSVLYTVICVFCGVYSPFMFSASSPCGAQCVPNMPALRLGGKWQTRGTTCGICHSHGRRSWSQSTFEA